MNIDEARNRISTMMKALRDSIRLYILTDVVTYTDIVADYECIIEELQQIKDLIT